MPRPQVLCGDYHNLSLKANGTLWAWGANWDGELGDGTTDNKTAPVQIGADADWVYLAAGRYHSLAVKSDGTVWAWGYNRYGQLGDGTITDGVTPCR